MIKKFNIIITKQFYGLLENIKKRSELAAIIIAGIFLAVLIVKNPFAAVFFVLACSFLLYFASKPLGAMALLIILIPLSKTAPFRISLLIKGTEPLYLIVFFVFLIALFNLKDSVKVPRYALIFILTIITIFATAVLNSLSHMDLLNMHNVMAGRESLSSVQYLLKTLVRPLFYFLPIVIIIKFVKSEDDLDFIIKFINIAVIILALCILYIFIFLVNDKGSPRVVNEFYTLHLGIERNALGDFFILSFPFMLARYYLKKDIFNILSICFSIVAVGFLYSRTAYVAVVLSLIIYLFVTKRAKFLPIFVIIALGLTVIVSESIIERASKGFDSGDRNEISAGRIDNQWIPLIQEYLGDPQKLLFGNGRFAIVNSKSVAMGDTPDSMLHPHNMFVEQFLDTGIILFIITLSFFGFVILKFFRSLKNIKNHKIKEYQSAVFVSIISFFIAGMTGRTLFPSGKNAFFWLSIGLGIAVIQMIRTKEDSESNA